jgi:two-component system nitrate/nitrite response regulator NarL
LRVHASADRDHATASLALAPNVVLLDVETTGALEWVREIAGLPHAPPVVAFAVSESEQNVMACVEAGVSAYVPQGASLEDLVTVIQHVVRGEALCSPQVVGSLFRRIARLASFVEAEPPALLTPREHQVFQLLERRFSNKEIASELHIGLATVKNHVHNILAKLHAGSREQAVRMGRARHFAHL